VIIFNVLFPSFATSAQLFNDCSDGTDGRRVWSPSLLASSDRSVLGEDMADSGIEKAGLLGSEDNGGGSGVTTLLSG
jgi:hypothetical protein